MLRALVGLVIGFVAAAITFLAVDRYGTRDDVDTQSVFDELDYDGYCADSFDGARAMRVGDGIHDWLCGRRLNGVWSPTAVDHADLCRWQFGPSSEPQRLPGDTAFDWICIAPRG